MKSSLPFDSPLDRRIVDKKKTSTLGVCSGDLLWRSVLEICCEDLVWRFGLQICLGDLVWRFGLEIWSAGLLWRFGLEICSGSLLWSSGMEICSADLLGRFALEIRSGDLVCKFALEICLGRWNWYNLGQSWRSHHFQCFTSYQKKVRSHMEFHRIACDLCTCAARRPCSARDPAHP